VSSQPDDGPPTNKKEHPDIINATAASANDFSIKELLNFSWR
jgi:hypothetical protein